MTDPTEKEIAAVSTAPRVTQADIEANIVSEWYFTAADGAFGAIFKCGDKETIGTKEDVNAAIEAIPDRLHQLTFCVLVARNGFTVTGESACASKENFDAEIGRRVARANAVQKLWPLMGYALKQDLHRAKGSN
jgi:hypothetical protein